MTKQTAANNATLARVKSAMNAYIFSRFSQAYNNLGPAEARRYLGKFFNDEAREERLAHFFGASGWVDYSECRSDMRVIVEDKLIGDELFGDKDFLDLSLVAAAQAGASDEQLDRLKAILDELR